MTRLFGPPLQQRNSLRKLMLLLLLFLCFLGGERRGVWTMRHGVEGTPSSCHGQQRASKPIRTHTRLHSISLVPYHHYRHESMNDSSTYSTENEADSRGDSLLLSFRIFNTSFQLILSKHDSLLAPEAVVQIHSSTEEENDPTVSHSPLTARAYHGHVKNPFGLHEYDESNWAAITFESPIRYTAAADTSNNDAAPLMNVDLVGEPSILYTTSSSTNNASDTSQQLKFHGTFVFNHIMYHVKTVDAYRHSKWSMDADYTLPPNTVCTGMMAFVEDDDSFFYEHLHQMAGRQLNPDSDSVKTFFKQRADGNRSVHGMCGNVAEHSFRQQADGILHKRQSTSGCPTTLKYLFMAAAADCTYISTYQGTSGALQQILADWNTASQVYKSSFNIGLGLISVQMFQTCTPGDSLTNWNQGCSDAYTINQRLSDFSRWRGQKSTPDQAGLWHLMTQCATGMTVGVAWIGQMCNTNAMQQGSSWVSGTGVSSVVPVEWKVVAHEIGHGFGAIHDCSSLLSACPCTGDCGGACCPCSPNCDCGGQYIMHPTDNALTNQFSPCSITAICSTVATAGTCLQAPGALSTISSGICGNGIREGKEECDCGSSCATDSCCTSNCTFTAGSVCDSVNDVCCTNCQYKAGGTLCQATYSDCDFPVYCSGKSGDCPLDNAYPDGKSCKTTSNVTAQCASGICTSRDLQCQGRASVKTIKACSTKQSDCTLVCEDSSGQCYQLNGRFINGSPCGYSYTGKCQSGTCSGMNIIDQAMAFFQNNLAIAIPVVLLGGICVLSILVFIGRSIFRCWQRHSLTKRSTQPSGYREGVVSDGSRESLPSRVGPSPLQPRHEAGNPRTANRSNIPPASSYVLPEVYTSPYPPPPYGAGSSYPGNAGMMSPNTRITRSNATAAAAASSQSAARMHVSPSPVGSGFTTDIPPRRFPSDPS